MPPKPQTKAGHLPALRVGGKRQNRRRTYSSGIGSTKPPASNEMEVDGEPSVTATAPKRTRTPNANASSASNASTSATTGSSKGANANADQKGASNSTSEAPSSADSDGEAAGEAEGTAQSTGDRAIAFQKAEAKKLRQRARGVGLVVSGVVTKGDRDFPPEAVKSFHEKPLASHDRPRDSFVPPPLQRNRVIYQPK